MTDAQQLNALITEMAKLEIRRQDLVSELATVKEQLVQYNENLIPEAMDEMEASDITTKAGLRVQVSSQVIASFPKDHERRQRAFDYLESSGNGGLIKHEISIKYGKDSKEMADKIMTMLDTMGVEQHAAVVQKPSIHHQSMLKFLRDELKRGADVPMDAFGAFEKRIAKIKT